MADSNTVMVPTHCIHAEDRVHDHSRQRLSPFYIRLYVLYKPNIGNGKAGVNGCLHFEIA